MALLVVSIAAARPLTADPRANLLVHVAAFFLVLAGGGLRSWAMGYHAWRRTAQSQRRLLTAGPYRVVRNPLYLGTLLISAGVALMSGWWPILLVYLLLFWPSYLAIILWEEEKLSARFGQAYRDYCAVVPRLLPGLHLWRRPEGTFSLATTLRCMEPLKVAGFLAALVWMAFREYGRG